MSSDKATPRGEVSLGLPWTLSEEHQHPWRVECESNIPGIKGMVCEVSYRPMAELIVRAVNRDALWDEVVEMARIVVAETNTCDDCDNLAMWDRYDDPETHWEACDDHKTGPYPDAWFERKALRAAVAVLSKVDQAEKK